MAGSACAFRYSYLTPYGMGFALTFAYRDASGPLSNLVGSAASRTNLCSTNNYSIRRTIGFQGKVASRTVR